MQSVSITTKVVSSNSTVEISLDKPSKTFSSFVVNFSSEYFGVSHIIVKIKNLKTLSHDVVFLALIEIQTHNISGDRH